MASRSDEKVALELGRGVFLGNRGEILEGRSTRDVRRISVEGPGEEAL